jgi:isopenicillin N synthase-like dioxygenase
VRQEILDVDLARFEKGDAAARQAVVEGVRCSLETGFVYVRHDIPDEVLDGAYELLAAFFHLERDVKERYAVPESHGQTGYTGMLVETAVGAAAPDFKEMLNWGRELAPNHPLRVRFPGRYLPRAFPEAEVPGITEVLGLLYDRLFDLQRRFLRIVALGIGCAEGYFDGMVRDGTTLTRAIRYPPMEQAPGGEHVWAAEHGDINLVTALPRATARGLQIRTDEGWVDAAPPDGCAILNTGLMLERVTNHVIPAGIHRVVAGPAQAGERISVVQFCHPAPWTILAPVPGCVGPDRPVRDPHITAGDWLDLVLHELDLA